MQIIITNNVTRVITIRKKPNGFWKNEQNVIDSLTLYVNELGYIPSLNQLRELDSSLARAINRYYPMEVVYRWFGMENEYKFKDRKPAGFWLNKENVITRIKEIIDKVGEIPSPAKLIELGHHDLVSAISHHYNFSEIREWFDMEEQNKRDRSKYKDLELLIEEIKMFLQTFDGTLTVDDFRDHGKYYLLKAMYDIHGISYSNLLETLDIEKNKMVNGYWQSQENVLKMAKQIIAEYGYLPSQRALSGESKYQTFCRAVSMYYGGFHQLRRDLELSQLKKKQGFWKDENALLNDLKEIIKHYGHIPTYLHKKGYDYLVSGLQYYGGIYNFAKKHNLPLENTRVPYTHYDDEEKLENKVKEIVNNFGRFPSRTELVHYGEWALLYRLCNKYGSIVKASLAYGFNDNIIVALDEHLCDSFSERIVDDYLLGCEVPHERGIKLDLSGIKLVPDFILSENVVIEVLMFDYRLPFETEMQESYVQRYLRKKEAYDRNEFKVIEIFPEDLRNKLTLDSKLYDQIKGFAKSQFKDLTKIPLSIKNKRPPGYWKLFKNVKKEILPICEELNRFPTRKELKERGLKHVETISKFYHGSLREVAKKLGYPYK